MCVFLSGLISYVCELLYLYIYYVTVVINAELRKFSEIVYLADLNWNLSLIICVDNLIS